MRFGLLLRICVAATMIFLDEEAMASFRSPLNSSNLISGTKPLFGELQLRGIGGNFFTPEECNRACRDGEPPMICYYHFTLENYNVLGPACDLCRPNATNSIRSQCQCILADGVERAVLTVNRMIPGPSIQICVGDTVVIDVDNKMNGMETAIHWQGLLQNGFQYYDGVSGLTQCPIPEGTTFRYEWTANNAGTHFWHSQAGTQLIDSQYGSLIVRDPPSSNPHRKFYDEDRSEHIIVISDLFYESSLERFPGRYRSNRIGQAADNVLINGKGDFTDPETGKTTDTPLEVFTVESGQRYRFRLINSFGTACPANISIQAHKLTVIATDGNDISPVGVDTIVSFSGERYDFVINANQPVGAYWMQLRATGECGIKRVQNLAIIRYKNGPKKPTSIAPTYDKGLPLGVVLNPLNSFCNTPREDVVCVSQLKSLKAVDSGLLKKSVDQSVYVPFQLHQYPPKELFKPDTYNRYLVPSSGVPVVALVDGISFEFPPSPPLSQSGDISADQFCSGHKKPVGCGDVCSCTNQVNIPLGASVEFVLFNTEPAGNRSYPFHLHGYAFHVISMGKLPKTSEMELKKAIGIDLLRLSNGNFTLPPAKDTIAVPQGGYVFIRLRADNPGYWLFHSQIPFDLEIGMALVLHVGTQHDLPPVPPRFPTCGDFVPLT